MYNNYGNYQPYEPSGSAMSPPPSLSNATAWFDYFDSDRGGTLDREEVVNGLIRTMNTPVHQQQNIRETVYSIWTVFDLNHSGSIDKREFCAPGGLGESLLAMAQSSTASSPAASAPYRHPTPSAPPAPSAPYQSQSYQATHQQPYQPTYQQPYQQPAQPQSKTIRVGIPNGVGPGQQVQIPTGEGGQAAVVTIPDRSRWIYSTTGQPTFDCTVPVDPVPIVQATDVASSATPSTTNYQPSSSSAITRTAWRSYESITGQPYQSPPLGMTTVNIPMAPSFVRPSGRRRALIIGINYTGTRAALRGCVNDANNMKRLLLRNGFPDDTCHMVMLTDSQSNQNYRPTSANIFRAMAWLMQGVAEGDVLFFHFSGHGAQVPDKSGHEADGLNETILPLDYERKQITDDELWGALVYPLPSGVRMTALMDCCHSGTGLDLPFEYRLANRTKNRFGMGNHRPNGSSDGQWIEDVNPAHSQGDVVLFSGCEDSQTSADTYDQQQAGGAMTQSFISAYEQNPYATYPDFMAAIHKSLKKRRFKQRPQLTASQPFDAKHRVFSFVEGIEPNRNRQIGRIKRRHVRPGRTGGGGRGGPMDAILFGGGVAAGALLLGELLF